MKENKFPRSLGKLFLLYQNFVAKIGTYSTQVGITPAAIARMQTDLANLQYLISYRNQFNDSKSALSAFQEQMVWGPTDGTAQQPTFESVALPEADQTGIATFFRQQIKLVKASAAYNPQMAEELGLATAYPSPVPDADYIPTLRPGSNVKGQLVAKFKKSGYDGAYVEYRLKGELDWTVAGTFVRSPAVISPASQNRAKSETYEVRAQLIRGNEPVTSFSEIYTVVTKPV